MHCIVQLLSRAVKSIMPLLLLPAMHHRTGKSGAGRSGLLWCRDVGGLTGAIRPRSGLVHVAQHYFFGMR